MEDRDRKECGERADSLHKILADFKDPSNHFTIFSMVTLMSQLSVLLSST